MCSHPARSKCIFYNCNKTFLFFLGRTVGSVIILLPAAAGLPSSVALCETRVVTFPWHVSAASTVGGLLTGSITGSALTGHLHCCVVRMRKKLGPLLLWYFIGFQSPKLRSKNHGGGEKTYSLLRWVSVYSFSVSKYYGWKPLLTDNGLCGSWEEAQKLQSRKSTSGKTLSWSLNSQTRCHCRQNTSHWATVRSWGWPTTVPLQQSFAEWRTRATHTSSPSNRPFLSLMALRSSWITMFIMGFIT